MKKIVFVLIAAYLCIFVFQVYQRLEYNKGRSDQQWQYFKQVIFARDIDVLPDIHYDSLLRWDEDSLLRRDKNIEIQIVGHPTAEDVKTIKETVSQLSSLIAPKKIEFTDYSGDISINIFDKSEMEIFTSHWPKNVFSQSRVRGVIVFKDGLYDITRVGNGEQLIRADSTTQLQRNNYIVKGMVNIFLGLGRYPDKKLSQHTYGKNGLEYYSYGRYNYYDNNGNDELDQLYSDKYKNSIFNSYCKNCTELTDVDKYIIQTYYSPKLDEIIKDHNETSYFGRYQTLQIILVILCIIIIAFCFSGFFSQIVFPYIDRRVKNRWLAFNCKTLSFSLFSLIFFISTLLWLYYLYFPTNTEYQHISSQMFLAVQWNTFYHLFLYALILANGIYLIEKVWITRFEQFAKQQLFSFVYVILVASLPSILILVFTTNTPRNDGTVLIFGVAIGLVRFLFNYSNYQKRLAIIGKELEIKNLRELKTRAELNALQSKINPHFLYNALNSIAGLAHENADKVEQMAMALSKLFRYSINKEDTDFASVQNEVEMVSVYLEIEKVRFDDRLLYSIDMAENVREEKIPMFIIQPLVENAIKHGIANVTGKALLTLDIFLDKNRLIIKVADNGPAFPEDLITGFGLHGIYEKLDILYPGRYEIKIQNGVDKNISILLNTSEK